jgi:hypothetical protein
VVVAVVSPGSDLDANGRSVLQAVVYAVVWLASVHSSRRVAAMFVE